VIKIVQNLHQLALSYEVWQEVATKVIAARDRVLRRNHEPTLINVSVPAMVLQGKHDEAKALNRWALEGWKTELGEQHHDTLTSASDLAGRLQAQGKYEEAQSYTSKHATGFLTMRWEASAPAPDLVIIRPSYSSRSVAEPDL
jgi:hypothetical protein